MQNSQGWKRTLTGWKTIFPTTTLSILVIVIQARPLARLHDHSGSDVNRQNITYDSRLPGRQRMQLDAMNMAAKNLVDVYVPPLHPRNVIIKAGDKYGIHFDMDTVCRVLTKVVEQQLTSIE
jgi:hypothetical protein